jgi:uncharacterized membrane protein
LEHGGQGSAASDGRPDEEAREPDSSVVPNGYDTKDEPSTDSDEVVEGEAIPLQPSTIKQITRVVRAEIRHSGPLPNPRILAGYEDVQAGFAERIMAMAEREQEHRHQMDRKDLDQSYGLASRGQIFGLVALVIMASLAITLAVLGHPGWAAVVGGIDVVGVVSVFVTGQVWSREEKRGIEPSKDEPKSLSPGEDDAKPDGS